MSYIIVAQSFECDTRYVGEGILSKHRFVWSTFRSRAVECGSLEACRTVLDTILDDDHQLGNMVAAFGITPSSSRKITLEIHEVAASGKLGQVMDRHVVGTNFIAIPTLHDCVTICMQH